jgi:hypothetical protein
MAMGEFEGAPLTEPQRYSLEHILACEAQGQTVTACVAEHGVAVHAMCADKKMLVRNGVLPGTRPARFQPVRIVDAVVGSESRIQLPTGVSVAFSEAVDPGR